MKWSMADAESQADRPIPPPEKADNKSTRRLQPTCIQRRSQVFDSTNTTARGHNSIAAIPPATNMLRLNSCRPG
jgi:hypothetical protein